MFIPSLSGADASTAFSAQSPVQSTAAEAPAASLRAQCGKPDHVRHMLFGPPAVVQATINFLHHLGYAEPNDWSRAIGTGRANEVMAILTKRISL